MTLLRSILLVAMGGALGSVGRFLLSKAVQEHAATAFPVATFAVNAVGCFVIGLVYGLSLRGNEPAGDTKLLLATGFCGGFTTFSTFCNEGLSLLRGDASALAFAYIVLSVVAGFAAVAAGLWAGRKMAEFQAA